jgi:transposase
LARLYNEHKEFIKMDLDLGLSNVELAKRFGVSEGTIRYHRKRNKEQKGDGRKNRYSAVSQYSTPIECWIRDNPSTDPKKRTTVHSLYRKLKDFHQYNLSYDALRRFISREHPEIMEKPYHNRMETPPGKLSQVDWKENVQVQLEYASNWVTIHFLLVLLCFSRHPAIVVRTRMDQHSFLSAHTEAVKKTGGVSGFYRPDCMATAVRKWNGQQSQMTEDYQKFLKEINAQAFPARPGTATDKGKVERKIQDIFHDIDFRKIIFRDLEHLQSFIDQKVDEHCRRTMCPATGTTIAEAFEYEKKFLNPLPKRMPDIPIQTLSATVQKGSLVWFKGNYYQIPEGFVGKNVRCVNSGTHIRIYHEGHLLDSHVYVPDIRGMVKMSETAIRTSKRPMSDLTRSWGVEVAQRQLDYYHEITGVPS